MSDAAGPLGTVLVRIASDVISGGAVEGVGADIISVERIRRIRLRDRQRGTQRFDDLAFTPREIAYCRSKQKPAIHFAGHLAAKEAVYKALRLRWEGPFAWTFIEVCHREDGSPFVRPGPTSQEHPTKSAYEAPDFESVAVSIAHTEDYAIAVACIRQNCPAS